MDAQAAAERIIAQEVREDQLSNGQTDTFILSLSPITEGDDSNDSSPSFVRYEMALLLSGR